jgi:serine/threonine-protein kinase HipA
MPIRPESYSYGKLLPIFEMNRPEGYLLDRIRQKFAREGGLDDMMLLKLTGENQIGRLRYREPGVLESPIMPKVGLKEILRQQASEELFEFLVDTYLNSGISGFQPKVMLPDADKLTGVSIRMTALTSDLIVKSSDADYPFLTQNEFLCMESARRAGIPTPRFWLSEDGTLFIMERFDLDNGRQLGFEDMAVLMKKDVERKYEGSYENIITAIGLFCGENTDISSRQFFEYITLSVMVRNGDAHLKNFGLLYDTPVGIPPTLAPLYDVVTTSAYDIVHPRTGATRTDRTLALKLRGHRDYPTRSELIKFGREVCHVSHPETVIERISDSLAETLRTCCDRVNPKLLKRMEAEWDSGRLSLSEGRIFAAREKERS